MSAKRGMTLSQILLILMITGIFITLSVSSWNPPKDENGNVINTKTGTYANEIDFSGETEAFYNSPMGRELGSVELKGQTIEDVGLTNCGLGDSKPKFYFQNYEPNSEERLDDVVVSFKVMTAGTKPTLIEVDELNKLKLLKDGYYVVVEEETK